MLAGPVKIHPRVLRVMSTTSIGHRTSHFRDVCHEIRDLLRYAFDTKGPVAVISGSGTAGLEAMLGSLLRPQDRVLCVTNGKFGERLYEISRIYARADRMDFPWGKAVDLERLRERVEEDDYAALTLCHNETSTGVTNQAAEVGRIARKAGLLYLVDGITSVAGIPVDVEGWGIDAVVLGSQKCLAAPAGLSAVALSERGYEALRDEGPYYLNLKAHVDRLERGDTPYTPAIHLFLAFREALRMLKEEGLRARIDRTARLAMACRAAAEVIGLSLFPDPAHASNTVSAILYPDGVEDAAFRTRLREEYRVVVAGGQGELKGRIFRIGHMGICSFSDLVATFAAIEAVLAGKGHKLRKGASIGAIEEFMG
jgi:aspartate aminotransferase-like enzyme